MPSPVGHALAGLALAWVVTPRHVRPGPGDGGAGRLPGDGAGRWLGLAAVLAVAPDLDILLTVHRASWHSVSAAALVAAAIWLIARAFPLGLPAGRLACLACFAWLSHVGLDWLGRDTSAPQGIMAGWPFSRAYVHSGLDVFTEISRRYWNPDEFIWGNLRSVVREIAILGPIAGAVGWYRHRRPARPIDLESPQ